MVLLQFITATIQAYGYCYSSNCLLGTSLLNVYRYSLLTWLALSHYGTAQYKIVLIQPIGRNLGACINGNGVECDLYKRLAVDSMVNKCMCAKARLCWFHKSHFSYIYATHISIIFIFFLHIMRETWMKSVRMYMFKARPRIAYQNHCNKYSQ